MKGAVQPIVLFFNHSSGFPLFSALLYHLRDSAFHPPFEYAGSRVQGAWNLKRFPPNSCPLVKFVSLLVRLAGAGSAQGNLIYSAC